MPYRKRKGNEIMGKRKLGRSSKGSCGKSSGVEEKGEEIGGIKPNSSSNEPRNNIVAEKEVEGISNNLRDTHIILPDVIPMEAQVGNDEQQDEKDIDYAEEMLKNKEGFLRAYQAHKNNNVDYNFEDVIATKTGEPLDEMWDAFYEFITECALDMFPNEAETNDMKSTEESEMVITGIVLIGRLTVEEPRTAAQKERLTLPTGFIQTITLLHEILPSISSQKDNVRNNISKLCELWHSKQLPDHDNLTNNTLLYLLQRATGKIPSTARAVGLTKADIKRVHSMQSAILDYNINDSSMLPMRELLLAAAQTILFYKTQEGVRFLSFVFTLSPAFILNLHASIKTIIPGATSQVATGIGQVYFKAWRSCEGTFKTNIEDLCIQDLMQAAILANPTVPKNLKIFTPIRHILQVMHHVKNDRQAQAMLSKLYEPILWRHLKVANSHVRENAAQLFFDAFPVEDPNVQVEERSMQQGEQVQKMCELLKDESPQVRIISVQGASLLIAKYWQILSSSDLNSLVKIFVVDLAVDASSHQVRAEVLKGFKHILKTCVRSHLYLKKILPKLCNMLHDVKDGVREAMVELLCAVSNVKMIKYWEVCPLDHILARLEVEKSSVICTKIVDLLFNSFFPINQEEDTKVKRCIYLIQQNQAACRKFYRFCTKFVSMHDQVKFMLAVLVALKRNVRAKCGIKSKHEKAKASSHDAKTSEPLQAKASTFESQNTSDSESDADKENDEGRVKKRKRKRLYTAPNKSVILNSSPSTIPPQEYTQSSISSRESSVDRSISQEYDSLGNLSLDLNDTTILEKTAENEGVNEPYIKELEDLKIVGALVDVVCILYMARSTDIAKDENSQYRSLLEKKTPKLVSVLFKYYKSSDVSRSLIYLCSFLQHSTVVTMAGYCLSQLRNSEVSTRNNQLAQSSGLKNRLENVYDSAWIGQHTQTLCEQTKPFSTYVDALCNWGRGDDILELVTNWMSRDLRQRQLSKQNCGGPGKNKGNTSRKGVRFSESAGLGAAKPELAIQLIKYMFRHPVNREILLRKNRPQVEELRDTLKNYKHELAIYLPIPNSVSIAADQDDLISNQKLLCEAWDSVLKLTIMLHSPKHSDGQVVPIQKEGNKGTRLSSTNSEGQSDDDVFIILEDLVEWAEKNLITLPQFNKDIFSLRLLNSLLNACSNTVTLHIPDANFVGLSLEFAIHILGCVVKISYTNASNQLNDQEADSELQHEFDYEDISAACLKPICR